MVPGSGAQGVEQASHLKAARAVSIRSKKEDWGCGRPKGVYCVASPDRQGLQHMVDRKLMPSGGS